MHSSLVRDDASFQQIVQRLLAHQEVAVDCEFHGEGRYYPQLCVLQLAFGDELWAVETKSVDLTAFAPVLAAEGIRKLLHDGRQDLPILQRATRAAAVASVFDTQIAAAFVGFGGSVGYAVLVRAIVGAEIDKTLQVSDWTRELSNAQIEYALDDVRYLGRVSSELRQRLEAAGRLGWAEQASLEGTARALSRPAPEVLYKRVASISKLAPGPLGILRELAIWRDRAAEATDKPPVTVANDLALKSMALQPPRDSKSLGAVRGLGSGRAHPWGKELLDAVVRGAARPEPKGEPSPHDPVVVEGLGAMLGLLRREVAAKEGLAAELMADQSELRALAEWHLGGQQGELPASLCGWRKELFGERAVRVLRGETAFRADSSSPSGVQSTP